MRGNEISNASLTPSAVTTVAHSILQPQRVVKVLKGVVVISTIVAAAAFLSACDRTFRLAAPSFSPEFDQEMLALVLP